MAAGLILVLATAWASAEDEKKLRATDDSIYSVDVGDYVYGKGGPNGWSMPAKRAALLARQQELQKRQAARDVEQLEAVVSAAPKAPAQTEVLPDRQTVLGPTPTESRSLRVLQYAGMMLLGMGIAGGYAYYRSRRSKAELASRILIVAAPAGGIISVAADLSPVPPLQMGTIPRITRRRFRRHSRLAQARTAVVPRITGKPSRDVHGESIRQLQSLGVFPRWVHDMTPISGRPVWQESGAAVADDVQMYVIGSDPIPNYAYFEDAPRMTALVERQKQAESMVWSNQQWRR